MVLLPFMVKRYLCVRYTVVKRLRNTSWKEVAVPHSHLTQPGGSQPIPVSSTTRSVASPQCLFQMMLQP